MSKIAFLLTLFVTVLGCLLPPAPAQATGAARTFVSAAGLDTNNCTNVATPCRHLAAAYAATAANGEIYVLDPANYGSLTITGPVSIEGHGWASIAPPSGGNAITINANTGDKINIIGVVLDGTALANTNGIQFNSGGPLTVRDSVIRNFGTDGIIFQPSSSGQSQFFVSNTLASDNGANGIDILPTGSGTTTGVLDHVQIEDNGDSGLHVENGTQTINMTISDSVSANNASVGIFAGWTRNAGQHHGAELHNRKQCGWIQHSWWIGVDRYWRDRARYAINDYGERHLMEQRRRARHRRATPTTTSTAMATPTQHRRPRPTNSDARPRRVNARRQALPRRP